MKKLTQLLVLLFVCAGMDAQVIVEGKTYLNRSPLTGVTIIVKDGNKTIQTLNTKNKNEFNIELDYGPVYRVYFQHPKCVLMHLEVYTNSVPKSRYDFSMAHAVDVPFVNKNDPDVDTTVFSEPFYKIRYDGKKHMEDDSAYSRVFDTRIIKKTVKPTEPVEIKNPEAPAVFAGKIYVNNNFNVPVKNRIIHAVYKDGYIIKTTATNRFGAFAFTGVKPTDIEGIKLEISESGADLKGSPNRSGMDLSNATLGLYNSKKELLVSCKPSGGSCYFDLTNKPLENIVDNAYTTNIGGKLVSTSPKEKKFFANKTVYLTNKLNTVLKTTKTNKLGSFVFEDIKPDNTYYVGIDQSELSPMERIDLLNKDDAYIATLDSVKAGKLCMKINTDYNKVFNNFTIGEDEMKMDIKATIFGDNVNHPIGKLKIILLNDSYQPIDSAYTDNFGTFKFKYLPFLKRFYLSAENTDNILDMYKNILIYSSEDNLVKIMTHEKGKKFTYNPVNAELSSLRDVELEDPWLEYIDKDKKTSEGANKKSPAAPKEITERILFEPNSYSITPEAKEILDKIILVLNTNTELKIEVGAHTDSKGIESNNMKLSDSRAKAVKTYICNAGISAERITTKGYGETRLLNNCDDKHPCSDSEHAQNRRIEFKISGN